MARILIIDDEEDVLIALEAILLRRGHKVAHMKDGSGLIPVLREFKPDLVVTDIIMPGISGSNVYQAVRGECGPYMPVIVSSATKMRLKDSQDSLLTHCPKPLDLDFFLEETDRLIAAAEEAKEQKAQ